jgi:hypothetical protein
MNPHHGSQQSIVVADHGAPNIQVETLFVCFPLIDKKVRDETCWKSLMAVGPKRRGIPHGFVNQIQQCAAGKLFPNLHILDSQKGFHTLRQRSQDLRGVVYLDRNGLLLGPTSRDDKQ